MNTAKPSQLDIVKGPHRWEAERKEYVSIGAPPSPPPPVGMSEQLAAILRGPHKFIPGEGGNPGRYVAVAEAPRPAAGTSAAGPVPGQPIRLPQPPPPRK